jgi:hypothetical protein
LELQDKLVGQAAWEGALHELPKEDVLQHPLCSMQNTRHHLRSALWPRASLRLQCYHLG